MMRRMDKASARTPMSSDKSAGHKAEELKGRAKEATGAATDDEEMQREGKIDQASSDVKSSAEGATEKVKDAAKRVTGSKE